MSKDTWPVRGTDVPAFAIAYGDTSQCCGCALGTCSDPKPITCECRCHDGAKRIKSQR